MVTDVQIRRITIRTTLEIDDTLLERAAKLTGMRETETLVRLALQTLIAKESSKRLLELAGTEKNLDTIVR